VVGEFAIWNGRIRYEVMDVEAVTYPLISPEFTQLAMVIVAA
jgi:hypothetical protein